MKRATTVAMLIGVVASVCAAPVPVETDTARMVRIFGLSAEPRDGTRYEMKGNALRVFAPAREVPPRPLLPAANNFQAAVKVEWTPAQRVASRWKPTPLDASRVWRDVTGDFEAVVRVSFTTGSPTVWQHPFVAGLVAFTDHQNHIGLVRSVQAGDVGESESFRVEMVHPRGVRSGEKKLPGNAVAAYLKLRRVGNEVTGSISRDGTKWVEFLADEVEWKDTVKVGIFACHFNDAPFDVTFDEYKLTLLKK